MPPTPRPARPARLLPWLAVLLFALPLASHAADAFDPAAATAAYLARIPAEARARSDAYFEGGYWLILWNLVVSVGLAWLLLRTGLSVKLRDFAERRFQRRWLQVATYALGYIVLMTILELPWGYYTGFLREHQYHMSNLTAAGWFGEQLKGLVVGLVLTTPVLMLLYWAIRRSPTRWWSRAAFATPLFMLLLFVIGPVFIEPMFNTYQPLPASPLRDSILSLARANGIPVDNVYQFDASRQTKRISANVSGAFGTIRVSLNDNLLNRCSPAEIRAVMGHEMGHYVLNHIYKLTIYHSLVIASAFAFTAWFFGAAFRRRGAAWGVRGIDDPAGLPILAAVLAVFFFLVTPVSHSITRSTESEADIFGLNAAREPDGFSEVALKLSEYRKLAPGPWEEIVFFDHPSGHNRILMSMRWKAEHPADPGK